MRARAGDSHWADQTNEPAWGAMYLRVVRARSDDEGGTRKNWEAWHGGVAPGLTGWLGGTAGVNEEGEVAALLMFEDEGSARRADGLLARSSEWRDFATSLDEPRLVHDLPGARMFGSGHPEAAGLVRIERGRVSEPGSLEGVAEMMETHVEEECPDILCYTFGEEGGYFSRALFITSRADEVANQGWRPGRLRRLSDRWEALVEDVERLELSEPWHLPAATDLARPEYPPPSTATQADPRLVAILDELLDGAQLLDGAAIVSTSGIPIISALPSDVNEDRIAAMSASFVALGERTLDEIARGNLKHTLIEGDDGYFIATTAGPGRTLVALAPKRARLGLVLFEVRRAAGNIALIRGSQTAAKSTPV